MRENGCLTAELLSPQDNFLPVQLTQPKFTIVTDMGTASRSSSASRSRSPRQNSSTTTFSSTERSRTNRGEMAASHQRITSGTSQTQQRGSDDIILSPTQTPTLTLRGPGASGIQGVATQRSLTIDDLKSVATDIKDALAAAISELRLDLRSLTDRVSQTETVIEDHESALRRCTRKVDDHALQMRDMNRHMEDLDNRGRRQNLRVRGLPESVEGDLISQSVVGLFNSILDRPPQTDIDLVRIHRALRPKGKEADPPRDVICCLADFRIKEDILRKARGKQLSCQGAPIQLFQDLSGITLKHRRDLRPLLNVLRDRNISYKWKFPFCLSASHQGRTVLLKVPEDLPHFCDTLGIPLIAVPDWYAMYRRSATSTYRTNGDSVYQLSSSALSIGI